MVNRRTMIAAASLAALPATASAQDKAVMDTLQRYAAAMKNKDAKALDEIFHESLTYSHSNCKLETKQQAIDAIVKGAGSYDVNLKDQAIRVFGNTAAVRGDIVISVTTSGKKVDNSLNVLYVMVKDKGKWRMAARQSTRHPA